MPGSNTLGLDAGEKRVGVAMVRAEVRIPVTLETLNRQSPDFWDKLSEVIKQNDIGQIVIGLPRGLEGQETAQTNYVRDFAGELAGHFALPVHWQDEALTSVQAENILNGSGKPYKKADVDALAASLILADYLEGEGVSSVAGGEV